MRVSLNWLKEYVQIDVEPRALADGLTMAGLEVEAMERLGHALDKVVAARIVSVERHSRADKLFVCHVDTGEREVQVISSAPNLAPGAVVPIALPGTRLPDGRVVKETKMVGEPSVGMLLAEDEMGLTDDHSG
ncbi:MAG: phenylalanine--tRNA ligase subunit beta, partial [Deltaproteobacteria bacterium]|nr:phenylalanine--tRNA ligase subunit beta [Deltaproteobacteria bacterium]